MVRYKSLAIGLVLLAASVFGAAVEVQVTQEAANNSEATGSTFNGGLDRRLQLMAMGTDGTVWLFFYGGANIDSLRGVRFDSWGTSYTWVATPLSTRGSINAQAFGDTIIVAQERGEAAQSAFMLRGIGSTLTLDTILNNANIGNLDGRPGAFMIGNKPAMYVTVDDAADSMIIAIADAWPITGNARIMDFTSTKYGSGWRTPTRDANGPYGILIFEAGAANDLVYWDSVVSYTDLSTTFEGSVNDYSDNCLMINDTAGIYIQQGDETGSADSVYVGTFKLRGVGTGTVTISTPATQQLLAAADNPVNILAYPNVSGIYGTDSVLAVWLQRANAANTDSVDIMGAISANEGITWGSPFVIQAAVDGRDKHHLQIPQSTVKDGSGNLIVYLAYTPQQTVDDSVYIVIDTIQAVGGAPAIVNTGQHSANLHEVNRHDP